MGGRRFDPCIADRPGWRSVDAAVCQCLAEMKHGASAKPGRPVHSQVAERDFPEIKLDPTVGRAPNGGRRLRDKVDRAALHRPIAMSKLVGIICCRLTSERTT